MNDMNHWAKKMQAIGRYKKNALKQWAKTTSQRQRIKMTEELLVMNDSSPDKHLTSPLFISLSMLLEAPARSDKSGHSPDHAIRAGILNHLQRILSNVKFYVE